MAGYRVGRIRLIFKLPSKACQEHLPGIATPGHLAYIEWFTAFLSPNSTSGMYKIEKCCNDRNELLGEVIEVQNIRRSCHLLPVCGSTVPRDWTSSTVLDLCKEFWVNPFSDLHMYMTMG